MVFKRKFKSAEKFFKKAFNNFIQINDRTRGEKVLLKLAECYIIEKQYLNAASTMRDAANLRLLSHKFINAIDRKSLRLCLLFHYVIWQWVILKGPLIF
ncbi:MAG: hypothetical protein ACTSRP_27845 [Candidatus Helarchaeota archaeon]